MVLAVLSLALAALLGFAIHRGSVCMVKGAAEVLSTGRAYMLLSFAKAALWVLIVTTPMCSGWCPRVGLLPTAGHCRATLSRAAFCSESAPPSIAAAPSPLSVGSATASLEPWSRSAALRSAPGAIWAR